MEDRAGTICFKDALCSKYSLNDPIPYPILQAKHWCSGEKKGHLAN